jgi:WXG100 family type VII secretion target
MSFSGSSAHLQLDPARVSVSADTIEARAADMVSRRAAVEESVESLLATWRGEAAVRFGALWAQWRDNADSVIEGLVGGVESIRGARDEMTATDADIGTSHARLRGRLG